MVLGGLIGKTLTKGRKN